MKKNPGKYYRIAALAAVVTAVAVAFFLPHTKTYYVDPSGADDADGSHDRPFRTVSAALAVVKKGDRIELRSGTYRECVELSADRVTLRAAKDAKVTVTGLDTLDLSFTPWRDGIYVADCAEPVECLFDGERELLLARWPNAEVGRLISMPFATATDTSDTAHIAADLPTAELAGARAVLWPGAGYTAISRRVTSADLTGFVTDAPMTAGDGTPEGYDTFAPVEGNRFYLCDALALLDAPGEWYYDHTEKKLYFCPPDGKTPAECALARKVRETGLRLTGKGIRVEGIDLLACAVKAEGKDCVLECVNSRAADYFLDSEKYDYTKHIGNCLDGSGNVWKDSEICDAWGNGLRLQGENNRAERLYIHDIDYAGGYFGGISAAGKGQTVEHCTITRSGRYLIYYNGGGHTFRANDLSYASQLTADCGAVYTWGNREGGTLIEGNYVHDNPCAGLYVDNNCTGIRVEKNVSVNNRYGIICNSQMLDCTVRENLFYANEELNSTYCYDADVPSMKGSIIEGNRYAGDWMLVKGENAPIFRDNTEITEFPFDWEAEIPEGVGCGRQE